MGYLQIEMQKVVCLIPVGIESCVGTSYSGDLGQHFSFLCKHYTIKSLFHKHEKPVCRLYYSCVFNTSHTVLGDMPNFYEKPVCITRHAIPFYERPGCNTEHTNSLLMWQWHHYCFEVTREGLRPGCNSRHGTLFTQRPGWNKRIWGEIQWVLNRNPVTCIQD